MDAPIAWPTAATRHAAFRLRPGEDLRGGIEAAFARLRARAGFVVAAVGSLSGTMLRHAAADDGSFRPGPLEIVALSGTLGPVGPHLHLAVAGADGSMTGGHLLHGCEVRTTAEIVLGLTDAVAFERPVDSETGYHELAIRRLAPRGA